MQGGVYPRRHKTQMSKSKGQIKSKCLNAKTISSSHLSFELSHLTLFRLLVWFDI